MNPRKRYTRLFTQRSPCSSFWPKPTWSQFLAHPSTLTSTSATSDSSQTWRAGWKVDGLMTSMRFRRNRRLCWIASRWWGYRAASSGGRSPRAWLSTHRGSTSRVIPMNNVWTKRMCFYEHSPGTFGSHLVCVIPLDRKAKLYTIFRIPLNG